LPILAGLAGKVEDRLKNLREKVPLAGWSLTLLSMPVALAVAVAGFLVAAALAALTVIPAAIRHFILPRRRYHREGPE